MNSGYAAEMSSIVTQMVNNHKFQRASQRALLEQTIDNNVGMLIQNVGEDIKETVRTIVKDGYDKGLHPKEIAKNINHEIDTINNTRARTIARTEVKRTDTVANYVRHKEQGATGFNLWKGASLGFYGMTNQLPGLMNTETGMMTLYQHAGRWHFTASAVANKYWMPWQHTLSTQYCFGGTLGYDLNESISLHAFGYYYANQLQVGPAMSPFVNSTTYGGYADIRFNNTFGTKMGVRRYVSPWTGKWITEPIINPYIKIGDSKIELPVGGILKALVWGDRDDPMRFQPRPHPIAQPGQRIRR